MLLLDLSENGIILILFFDYFHPKIVEKRGLHEKENSGNSGSA